MSKSATSSEKQNKNSNATSQMVTRSKSRAMTRKKNNTIPTSNIVTRSKSKKESASSNTLINENNTILNENNIVYNDDYDDDNSTKLMDDDESTRISLNPGTPELSDTSDDGISTVDHNETNSLINENNLLSNPKKLNPSRDRNITFFERQKKEKDSLTDKTDETNEVSEQENTDKSLQWLTELQETYNTPDFDSNLDDSGRIFNGSGT